MKTETKEEALELLKKTRREFLAKCRQTAFDVCRQKGEVTIDDVRKVNPLPEGMDGRVYGAVFDSNFTLVGYTRTKRRTSHNRNIGIFKIREHE